MYKRKTQERHYTPRNEQSLSVGVWAQALMDGLALGIEVDADASEQRWDVGARLCSLATPN